MGETVGDAGSGRSGRSGPGRLGGHPQRLQDSPDGLGVFHRRHQAQAPRAARTW